MPQKALPARGRLAAMVLVALWGMAFGGAFLAFALIEPDDFGFTAGMNRVAAFLGLQVLAAGLAIPAALVARRLPRGDPLKWLGLVPVAVAGALAAGFVALIVWASMQRLPPDDAPRVPSATAPAAKGPAATAPAATGPSVAEPSGSVASE